MTWTRLSDGFADSPRVMALSDAAFRAHVTALIWSNRQLTDGVVPANAVRLFTTSPDPSGIVRELVSAGLWTEGDGLYQLDWSEQEPAAAVTERRDANAARVKKHRERARRHGLGDHSLCDRCNALRTPLPTPLVTPLVMPLPSRPVPTHREGRERDVHEVHESEQFDDEGAAPAAPFGASQVPPALEVGNPHVPGHGRDESGVTSPSPGRFWGTVPESDSGEQSSWPT